MRTILMAIAAALGAVAPAHAQIALEPGQAMTLTIATGGDIQVTGVRRGTVEPYDDAFLSQVDAQYKSGKEYSIQHMPDAPAITADQLDLRFVTIDGKATMLALANGYDDAIVYRAKITARGETKPTDVCLVMPAKRGYEHWPYVIDKIELSSFTHVAWKVGDPIPCA